MSNNEGMSQQALWQHYLAKNPHWAEEGAHLSAAGLRKLFEQTWHQGHKVGHQQAIGHAMASQFSDLSDLFGKQ
jgi:hypothetical protein